jgi:acetyl/propionyl-CoA carboxylase alpha subunit
MIESALAFARAIGYENAGTAEFMVDGRDFYFLELNGRIQVEHPVTELVTGSDLVRWQLEVAQGTRTVDQYLPERRGHAVEVRLYAEDPRTFFPQTGRVERLRLPEGIRVDAGVAEGDEIGIAYDPMIAKLIAHADTRDAALERLHSALKETEVEGVTTNLPFLRWLVAHPVVRAGDTTTAFLTEHPPLSPAPGHVAAAPWRTPFRLNGTAPASAAPPDLEGSGADDGVAGGHSRVVAPMPGTVIRLLVEEGDAVRARQPLVVLEAMKMETPLNSPYDAVVQSVHVAEGDQVAGGTVLVELEE